MKFGLYFIYENGRKLLVSVFIAVSTRSLLRILEF